MGKGWKRCSECLVMEIQSECGGGEGQNICEALGSPAGS